MKKRDFLKKLVVGGILTAAGLASKTADAKRKINDDDMAELALILLQADELSEIEQLERLRNVNELSKSQQQELAAIIRRGAARLNQTHPWA